MPANKKSTNKTAHVLNVITAGKDLSESESPVSDSSSASGTSQAIPKPISKPIPKSTFTPVLEMEHTGEDLADQVREALSAELQEGIQESSPVQQEILPDVPTDPTPQAACVTSPSAVPEEPRPVSPSRDPSFQLSSYKPQEWDPDESEYLNIMQALVEEKFLKYMKLLGVCCCSRCQADVKALTLSHLDPKYIVVRRNQNLPITVYDNHYNAAVTSQIIAACRTVMSHPRH